MRHTLTLTNCLIILIILVGFEFGVKVPSRKFGATFFETLKLFFKKGFGLTTFCIVSGTFARITESLYRGFVETYLKCTANASGNEMYTGYFYVPNFSKFGKDWARKSQDLYLKEILGQFEQ